MLGLAETLVKAGLTQAGLAELNFDVGALERYLLAANPEVDRYFSADEQMLYWQAVAITSRRLINTAPNVEGFELSTAAETLRRLDDISKQLGVERDLATQAADEFVGRYRGVVQAELDRLEVFGLHRMDRLTSQQSLSMAYITLSASELASGLGSGLASEESEALSLIIGRYEQKKQGVRRTLHQVDEAICNRRRIVIRGGAGAGKSTLMQWLAVRAASQNFEGKLASPDTNWNIKVPFFIRLRSLVGKEFPTPEKFPALIAQNIAAQMPEGWVHKYLDRGQALVLIDGVDELPKQSREAFLEALKALVRDFSEATYVVTSRPSGLKSEDGDA